MGSLTAVASLLIVFTATNGWAQKKPICALLTASEVATIGGIGKGTEDSRPILDGPTKGESVKLCNWRTATGAIHLSLARVPPGQTREAMLAQLDSTYATLRSQGWKEEKKEFGTIACSLMTPPLARQDVGQTTGCLTQAKGMVVSVATLGKTRVPMEKVKALMDSAIGRL